MSNKKNMSLGSQQKYTQLHNYCEQLHLKASWPALRRYHLHQRSHILPCSLFDSGVWHVSNSQVSFVQATYWSKSHLHPSLWPCDVGCTQRNLSVCKAALGSAANPSLKLRELKDRLAWIEWMSLCRWEEGRGVRGPQLLWIRVWFSVVSTECSEADETSGVNPWWDRRCH